MEPHSDPFEQLLFCLLVVLILVVGFATWPWDWLKEVQWFFSHLP